MNKDDVIRMAREAGLTVGTNICGVMLVGSPSTPGIAHIDIDEMQRFAALVREHLLSTDIHSCHADCDRPACVQTRKAVEAEREACAKVVDKMADYMEQEMEPSGSVVWVRNHAAAIRARGEVK